LQRYSPKEIEPKWQKLWRETEAFNAEDFSSKPKFVMLTEFPYPSGDGLHLGHIREYTYGDILARHKRMKGFNVLYPMGYDAFGLPTENYAIKNKVSPQSATDTNVANFQKQFESLGYSFDWGRSFKTTDPEYYKWTQWLFLQFFKSGMAYQDEIAINWCPFCKTGLSNEEVVNGRHERCDTIVEKKVLKQWLMRITDYADRLIDGLKDIDFPSRIADQQINWIGRSKGAEIKWRITDQSGQETGMEVFTFTTRKDTLPGVTFIVIAPESPLVEDLVKSEHKDKINSYHHLSASMTDVERQEDKTKSGVFTGAYAKNPFNDQIVPIYVANYVLAGYGTGVVMGMPGHDERDREFAIEHDLPVVLTTEVPAEFSDLKGKKVYSGAGKQINSGEALNGKPNTEAGKDIFEQLLKSASATERVTYRLRDWIFSRQRYWGEPIPIIHCPDHGAVAVPEDQLPVVLPKLDNYEPTENGESPLSRAPEWVNVACPVCSSPSKREIDTMPNWAGSSWYYLRYYDAHNDKNFAAKDKLDYWQEVDLYLGGMEHTTLHLLYSRFWHQFLYDQGLVPTPEPYHARRGQGIILAADGSKMSKSKGNVINPSEIIENGYGADALRLAISFLAPYDQTTPWSPESVAGTHRFLQRVWTMTQEFQEANIEKTKGESDKLRRVINALIKKVSADLDSMNFNTAIAALMLCVNELYAIKAKDEYSSEDWTWALKNLLLVLSPFAPHLSEELLSQLGQSVENEDQVWPDYEEKYLQTSTAKIIVQVNGKLRGELEMDKDEDEQKVVSAARAHANASSYINNGEIIKTIFVPNKLINFVVKPNADNT
jgi:leucyl-tRNA synthetase